MLFRELFSTRMRINSASYFVFALRTHYVRFGKHFSVVVPRGRWWALSSSAGSIDNIDNNTISAIPLISAIPVFRLFYRAMYYSAKHSLAIACRPSVGLSVRPSVCNVGGSPASRYTITCRRLEILESNCTDN